MKIVQRTLLAISLALALPAAAADNAMASAHWDLGFGAGSLRASYGLSLGLRGADHFSLASRLVDLNVDGRAALATIAGLPIAAHAMQVNQTADEAYDAAGTSGSQPWYARNWVLWTVGGLAATAALTSAGSSGGKGGSTGTGCTGTCGGSVNDSLPQESACVPGVTCVYCNDENGLTVVGNNGYCGSGFAAHHSSGSDERAARFESARLDTGTGGMGDLGEAQ